MQTNDEPLISCGIMVLEIGRNKLPDKSEFFLQKVNVWFTLIMKRLL